MAAQVRDRLLGAAIRIGQRDGFSTVTVADVLAESGAARQSLYTHFPAGTAQLTVAAVRLAADWISSVVIEACRQHSLDAISSFVEHWTTLLEGSAFSLGCPVAAAAASRPQHPEAAAVADAAFTVWESSIAAALVRDGLPPAQSRTMAVVVVASIEGAVTRCVAARSIEPMAAVHAHLRTTLAASLPPRPSLTATPEPPGV